MGLCLFRPGLGHGVILFTGSSTHTDWANDFAIGPDRHAAGNHGHRVTDRTQEGGCEWFVPGRNRVAAPKNKLVRALTWALSRPARSAPSMRSSAIR